MQERAIIAGLEVSTGKLINGRSEGERSLDELEELAATAGVTVVQRVLQKRTNKDAALYIGKGKLEEISLLIEELEANVLIFDDELSGAQLRNIENQTGIKVVDRTTLILDIFAQRAMSSEGKLQVELAQLKYRLPRLIGLGGQLSRLGGGIGTRGPGERKLEIDRRHIRRRISHLERELKDIGRRRKLMREGRKRHELPVVALVGYTNAGKSTLMNKLCNTDVFTEDKLFATLDPTVRKLELPDGRGALLVDTVGFIRKLPHELIEAFKSTLEEAVFADLLLHVVDSSDEEAEIQYTVGQETLKLLGATDKPVIFVLNKADIAGEDLRMQTGNLKGPAFEVSAVTGQGLSGLAAGIVEALDMRKEVVDVMIPYSSGWIISYLHENGEVLEEEFLPIGIKIKTEIGKVEIERIKEYIV